MFGVGRSMLDVGMLVVVHAHNQGHRPITRETQIIA